MGWGPNIPHPNSYERSTDQVVIGLGSGRCGTTSLAKLLDSQDDTVVTHEFCSMPWEFDDQIWTWNMNRFLTGLWPYDKKIIGDVGFYWINYVKRLLKLKPNAKFICLKRNRQETIDSYMAKSGGLNVHSTCDWFRLFPRYNLSPRDAVGVMWDDYYSLAERWQKECPDKFIIMDMHKALNNQEDQERILRFAGFLYPRINLNIRLNTTGKTKLWNMFDENSDTRANLITLLGE